MKAGKRTIFAVISAMVVNKTLKYTAAYDYERGRYVNFSASGNLNEFSLFDYSRSCYVSVRPNQGYDFGSSSYVSINQSGNSLLLFDYESGTYCNVTVNDSNVLFYDSESGQYYNFSVS